MTTESEPSIATRPITNCRVCGTPGSLLYEGCRSRGFSAPGVWSQRKCPKPACGLVWLDPVPTEEDIGKVYETYYTHDQPKPLAGLVNNVCWGVWKSYLRHRFGYKRGTGPAWTSLLWPLALVHPGGRAELDAGAMYLPAPEQPSRLLEVGCGAGVVLKRMQDMGWEVRGQEIDPKAVKAAVGGGDKVRGAAKSKTSGGKNRTRAVITDETRANVKKLVEEGKLGAAIAEELGISLPSVQNIKKVLGLVKARK